MPVEEVHEAVTSWLRELFRSLLLQDLISESMNPDCLFCLLAFWNEELIMSDIFLTIHEEDCCNLHRLIVL
jgi:hypothetical protein